MTDQKQHKASTQDREQERPTPDRPEETPTPDDVPGDRQDTREEHQGQSYR